VVEIGLSILDRTKVVTAASELARNTVVYGRGGVMSLAIVRDASRQGLRLTFEDQGPGSRTSIEHSRTATPPEVAWDLDCLARGASSTNSH
jgi:anti-sigma regulatory factor (Ser/Thr protein kinase)